MNEKKSPDGDLERDLTWLKPLVNDGFQQIGGPSQRALQAIRDEAARHAMRRRFRLHFAPLLRAVAAAAALAMLAATAVHTHLALRAGRHAQTVNLLLDLGAPQTAATPAGGASEFATRLLDIQGLDEEAFFTHEGSEALWL